VALAKDALVRAGRRGPRPVPSLLGVFNEMSCCGRGFQASPGTPVNHFTQGDG
jgi:hypothetical protein